MNQTTMTATIGCTSLALLFAGEALGQDDATGDATRSDLDSHLDFDLDFVGLVDLVSWGSDETSSDASNAKREADRRWGMELGSLSFGAFQDPAPAQGRSDLAEQATNPVAPLIQLQFQNNYVGESKAGSGSSNVFTIQPVIPWKLGKQAMLTRITAPVLVATPDLGDPIDRQYGFGDIVALNAMVFTVNKGTRWQAMTGPVLSFTIPTASSDFTGAGKYQAGPGLIYINTGTKGLQWGGLVYQQWSFASAGGDNDREEVSQLFFQPVFTVHLQDGWYVALQDILWTIDWNDGGRFSLPTGPRIGKVGKLFGEQKANIFVLPWYDLSQNNTGNEWGIKFNLTLLFPTG